MQNFYEKIKKAFRFISKIVLNNKTLLISLGVLLVLKIKYLPKHVTSTEFIHLLKSNKITSLSTLDKTMVVFKIQGQVRNFYSHYFIEKMDKFNTDLLNKNVNFTNYSDIFAFLNNPVYNYNISVIGIAIIAGILFKKYNFINLA
jgi:hypothetical protein